MSKNPISRDFERGVRTGVEAMALYFVNDDEQPIYPELSSTLLEQHREGATADALQDERRRLERIREQHELDERRNSWARHIVNDGAFAYRFADSHMQQAINHIIKFQDLAVTK